MSAFMFDSGMKGVVSHLRRGLALEGGEIAEVPGVTPSTIDRFGFIEA